MASAYAVLTFLFIIFEVVAAQHRRQLDLVHPGSSLTPSKKPSSWPSSSGRFHFGFYKQDAGFAVGIWLVTSSGNTIVWTANRDDPSVSSNAVLTLTLDGKLILKTEEGENKLTTGPFDEPASSASLLDSGNLVLYNNRSHIIWSSFDFPTDTILGGQNLRAGNQLFSMASETNSRTGRFRLSMQLDGNLVLYPTNSLGESRDAYWAANTNSELKLHLFVNDTGALQVVDGNMSVVRTLYSDASLVHNSSAVYRATVGQDGIFRFCSHYFASGGGYSTSVKWKVPNDMCHVKTFCGLNSYCTLYDNQSSCLCLPGNDFVDLNQMSIGCVRNFIEERCEGMNTSTNLYNMTLMDKISWDDYPYFNALMPEEDCRISCLEDCNCDAVLYKSESESESESGYCTKHKLPIKYARRQQGVTSSTVAYFKTGKRNITSDNNDDAKLELSIRIRSKKAIILILVMTVGFILCSFVFLAISGLFIFKYRVVKYQWMLENGIGPTDEFTLRSFSYSELKRATNGFREELGKGSFGAVYKGTLHKGEYLVAVKRLEKMVNDGEREFRAEMHAIGRTHHKNLVRLLGYCTEDSKRLLVYEYMRNGSLADVLFQGNERAPAWKERVRIALDVARGLLYLHDECEAPIIHCDIKPQNILMDEFWTPKISDFGLAKLLMPDQTRTFTLVRGTRGYMAPEWYKNTPISVKADVFSYGVVLLEIACFRRNMEIDPSKPEEIVLINWAYRCFIDRELNRLVRGEEVDKKTLENMIKVGLWCVQDEPALRPSMKSVVMMLEGISDIATPPCPTASSS
ncbi:hypothetical protein AB3S75_002750 [Citrus x aurantiifolia]